MVQALAEGARRIGDVVGLFSSIAGQNNPLALNATIEAVRAADAGKGFAAVASEVKSLARRTATATGEISAQISRTQGATEQAVAAIRGIVSIIEEVSTISTSIASAVGRQGAAMAEFARNARRSVSNTRNVTDAAAGEVLESASALSRQSDELSSEVNSFVANVRAACSGPQSSRLGQRHRQVFDEFLWHHLPEAWHRAAPVM